MIHTLPIIRRFKHILPNSAEQRKGVNGKWNGQGLGIGCLAGEKRQAILRAGRKHGSRETVACREMVGPRFCQIGEYRHAVLWAGRKHGSRETVACREIAGRSGRASAKSQRIAKLYCWPGGRPDVNARGIRLSKIDGPPAAIPSTTLAIYLIINFTAPSPEGFFVRWWW